MLVKLQFSNALALISVTLSGIVTLVKPQSLNTSSLICVNWLLLGKVTLDKLVHPLNAFFSMFVMLLGIFTPSNLIQKLKIFSFNVVKF